MGSLLLGGLLMWFVGNFLYDLFWGLLDGYHIKQADVIAYTLAHLLPFILAAILVGLIYLILRYEFSRSHPIMTAIGTSALPTAPQSIVSEETTTAYDVLHYMAEQSEWGTELAKDSRRIPLVEASGEFQRQARQGKVRSLGRLSGKGTHQNIPHEYWFVATIDALHTLGGQSQTMPAVPDHTGVPIYTDLRIIQADVYGTWPRRATG
jgi:hypothetical protein